MRSQAKLVVIGDSLSQGFTSGAIFRPDLSYPALIARSMGAEFTYPTFTQAGGLPINLELLLRELSNRLGARLSISDLIPIAFWVINYLNQVQNYWDKSGRNKPDTATAIFHNQSSWGFEIGDADTVTGAVATAYLERNPPNFLSFYTKALIPFYITAKYVLNPTNRQEQANATQITNVATLTGTQGIENLIFWLGANNAVGTVTTLKIIYSKSADLDQPPYENKATLYYPEHFALLYGRVAAKLARLQIRRVFAATIPHITLMPALHGLGTPNQNGYFPYYSRPWVSSRNFDPHRDLHLTGSQVQEINSFIDAYNVCIRAVATRYGWYVVETGPYLDRMAYNFATNENPFVPPPGLKQALLRNPLTQYLVHPKVRLNNLYLQVRGKGQPELVQGGLIGLDGIHPTTIGYGIIAEFFMQKMQQAGVNFSAKFPWDLVVNSDTLVTQPPILTRHLALLLDIMETPQLNVLNQAIATAGRH